MTRFGATIPVSLVYAVSSDARRPVEYPRPVWNGRMSMICGRAPGSELDT